ncbi:hypothetical protein A2291_04250 [candidate division WOR-1 bacterium RIFOXYB2_FULL_42_35]|uniref:Glycosyltransferase 2-like domain-containing protein n=1 Tax=candidate division WOR-1 bacterium RIFOXYC2_FULL_41_25 TaxID=1802586 RepID=A0A1F4TMU6_UNCSA|nr:MAG: hypothetical protein A2247_01090 [candidate division WOR-1 bacterium RIFOXYA2_FULL_41_14]OGC24343.1 MAG: hypothetical protein A2291_04250 [candidate division WOR-1 bacterium RIFOXYB2_FULL_42_35]OGC34045.1 MAG: hypothetical protein A2462_01655 [candidate division WOR-1 bacterium RIFOXYC2_FULL_41_25]OGC43817.1 MAG: hypothetical protein A2548_07965 [candidate division WOR-1 bacterium RIFOXYD2_FULL_41_8]
MKTLIFCTSYTDNDPQRYQNWINYYYPKINELGAEQLLLIDDGSKITDLDPKLKVIKAEGPLPDTLESSLNMIHFRDNLGRTALLTYPGWWRSFTFSVKLAQKYSFDKIIHIESDYYVVSQKLIDYLKKIESGWTALWSETYRFPETAIQVICKDAFADLEKFYNKGVEFYQENKFFAEQKLPFTKVEKGFMGDRYGENPNLLPTDIPQNADYVGQITRSRFLPG